MTLPVVFSLKLQDEWPRRCQAWIAAWLLPLTTSAFSFSLSQVGYQVHPLCLNFISISAFRSLELECGCTYQLKPQIGSRAKGEKNRFGSERGNKIIQITQAEKRESPLSVREIGHAIMEEVKGFGDLNGWVAVKGRFWKKWRAQSEVQHWELLCLVQEIEQEFSSNSRS